MSVQAPSTIDEARVPAKPFFAISLHVSRLRQKRLGRRMALQEVVSARIHVPTPNGGLDLELFRGRVLLIAGPNGVGKSSLLHFIGQRLGQPPISEIFSGHRQIHFNNEEIEFSGMGLEQMFQQLHSQPQLTSRTRGGYADQHLKSVMRRLLNRHNQDNEDRTNESMSTGRPVSELYEKSPRTLTVMNRVFQAARLPVEIVLIDGVMKAKKGDAIYSIDLLSDGERAALLIVGAILIRPHASFVSIDEPERHLNPAISGPLIAAAVEARPDVTFVFSSHDLSLIEWVNPSPLIHIQESFVVSPAPHEMRSYSINTISDASAIPDDLRYAVVGSRKSTLLVEGTTDSADKALYGLLYPGHLVIARGGAGEVISGVKSLSTNSQLHWLSIKGLIDRDGRDDSEVENLSAESVFTLNCPTIENLFFAPAVVCVMAEAAYDLFGSASAAQRMDAAEQAIDAIFPEVYDLIKCRLLMWSANRILSGKKLSVKNVQDGVRNIDAIDLLPLERDIDEKLAGSTSGAHNLEQVFSLPIKNTIIPGRVSSAIGYPSLASYKAAVIAQVRNDTTYGKRIVATISGSIPNFN